MSKPDGGSSDTIHQLDASSRARQAGRYQIHQSSVHPLTLYRPPGDGSASELRAHPSVEQAVGSDQPVLSAFGGTWHCFVFVGIFVLLRQGLPGYPRLVFSLIASCLNFPTAEIATCFVFCFLNKALVMW